MTFDLLPLAELRGILTFDLMWLIIFWFYFVLICNLFFCLVYPYLSANMLPQPSLFPVCRQSFRAISQFLSLQPHFFLLSFYPLNNALIYSLFRLIPGMSISLLQILWQCFEALFLPALQIFPVWFYLWNNRLWYY